MIFAGTALKMGPQIDTDLLFPSESILKIDELKEDKDYKSALVKYGLKNLDIDRELLSNATFIVAGRGFGAGSSRQYAAEVLKAYGIKGVVADSIHPIFYRNLWSLGLFAIEMNNIVSFIENGDYLTINLETGTIKNHQNDNAFSTNYKVPEWFLQLLKSRNIIDFLDKATF
jgi:3-isopropylmalate dehydratase small subunit